MLQDNAGVEAGSVEIPMEPIAGDDLVSGRVDAGSTALAEVAGAEVGLWEITEGTVRDTEADEVFVVLSGTGTVTFLESGESIELRAGTVVRLVDGTRTEWTITERLRKLYIA